MPTLEGAELKPVAKEGDTWRKGRYRRFVEGVERTEIEYRRWLIMPERVALSAIAALGLLNVGMYVACVWLRCGMGR